ncbi:hypothetical protein KUCAC02_002772, partial [Chaenocephalus aceratus]
TRSCRMYMRSIYANWDEYVSSLRAMLPWMVAYDNNRYGKWLPDFWAMLTALPADQVAFLRTDFTQSITGNPYSNMAWDMWIECTMNKENVNNVAQIGQLTMPLQTEKRQRGSTRNAGPKRMREDEQCVQDLVECMHEFDTFPFDTASTTLRTLQSAMPASDELVADFNSAHAAGEKKLTHFLEERALSKEKPSDELKAKAAEMERSALKAMINLVEGSQLVNLPELLEHRIVEECVPLFNSNGTFRKTQKSMLVQKLSLESVDLQESYIALVDMGMIWRMATPSAEDRRTQDGNPYKWSDYVHKLSSIILARHHNAHRIICVNDPYDTAYSTKDDERDLRVQGNTHVPNTYMKLGDAFPTARMFKTLLCSSSNKGGCRK